MSDFSRREVVKAAGLTASAVAAAGTAIAADTSIGNKEGLALRSGDMKIDDALSIKHSS